ncbi:MAG: glycosyl hydrolase [Flammeovirgaceae bacterium]|nr:glycosyl hydrolase [Flammeovirgaceae bacterium]
MKKTTPVILALFLIHSFFISSIWAQNRKSEITAYQATEQGELGGMEWRIVGPFRGGRSATVTGVIGNRNLYYMGTAGGGTWKTQDGGQTWENISDGFYGGSIGAVAVSESDPNVLYVGEGEQTVRGNVSSGKGLWKSTDAGKNWTSIGLAESEHIARIRIHPTNPDLVYVAAMGNLWMPNTQRGVFRSKDGGKTWEKILYESDKAGAVDLILDPNNPRIIYASTWEITRNGYRMDSGGPGSKLWRSFDSGDHWEEITGKEGLPKGIWGISGIAISPVNSNRIWVIIENEKGGVYRSDDGGEKWTYISSKNDLRQRAWYYSRIYADSQNEDRLYVMNTSYHRSNDGGKTWESFNAPHGDHHDFWIDPQDNKRMIIADDGGGQVSVDGGINWTTYHNQPTAQFYRVTTDNSFPFKILGAQQDNSTVRIAHRSSSNAITERDWEPTAGGESAHLAPDPENPNIVYGGTYKGYMSREDHFTGQTRSTNVWPFNPAGSGVEVMKYRFNWNYPLMFSPNDPKKLYAGSNYLHVTVNEGQSWRVISPDLTRNEPETLASSGGPITQDNTGVEFYGNIFALAESKQEPGVIYTGSDDGLIYVTRDGGAKWTNITPPMTPKYNMINCIDVDPHNAGGVYVAATSYKFGDYTPYLYKSKDYGKTWTVITEGIESRDYTRAIRADLIRPGLLYAGTEWGLYVSYDDGNHWESFRMNLPIVAIRDLHVREEYLIAATHGRGFWMIDDLGPVRQINKEIISKSNHLYAPKPAYRMAQEGRGNADLKREGENHPNGVLFNFFVADEENDIKLEILALDGALIRSFSNKSEARDRQLKVKSGGNRFVWDLRYPGFVTFPGMVLYSSPNRGPKAVPGTYRVRLIVGNETIEQRFEIIGDPRMPNTLQDYQSQFDFLIQVRDKVSEAHTAMLDIAKIKKDVDFIMSKVSDESLKLEMTAFIKELTKIEGTIHQTKNKSNQDAINYGIKVNNRLAFLMADQQRGDYPPTDQAYAVFKEMSDELDAILVELKILYEKVNGNSNMSLDQIEVITLPKF